MENLTAIIRQNIPFLINYFVGVVGANIAGIVTI